MNYINELQSSCTVVFFFLLHELKFSNLQFAEFNDKFTCTWLPMENKTTSFWGNIYNCVTQFETHSFYLLDQRGRASSCQINILSGVYQHFCLLTPPQIEWHRWSVSRSRIIWSVMRSFKASALRCCWVMTNLKHLVGREPVWAEGARSSSSYALRLQIDFWACWWEVQHEVKDGWMDGKWKPED